MAEQNEKLAVEVESEGGPGAPGPGVGEAGVGGGAAASERLLRAREVVGRLCALLGAEVEVEVRDTAEAVGCRIEVRRGGDVFEVGPRGQVLEALQYLVNRIVSRDGDERKWIALEIGAFPETGSDPSMEAMARRLGEAARRFGKTLTVVPIAARDRRIVHQTVGGMDGVRTRSEGEGILRRLLVEPVEEPGED